MARRLHYFDGVYNNLPRLMLTLLLAVTPACGEAINIGSNQGSSPGSADDMDSEGTDPTDSSDPAQTEGRRFPGWCIFEADNNGDGETDVVVTREYDDAERVLRETDRVVGGETISQRTYSYLDNGLLASRLDDFGLDGKPDMIWTYIYNPDQRLAREDLDYASGGALTTTYDYEGSVVLVSWDNHAGNVNLGVNSIERRTYDTTGQLLLRVERDTDADGTYSQISTLQYNTDRLQVSLEMRALPQQELTYRLATTYDASNRKQTVAIDSNGNGEVDSSTTYTYSEDGLVTVAVSNTPATDFTTTTTTIRDAFGNVTDVVTELNDLSFSYHYDYGCLASIE